MREPQHGDMVRGGLAGWVIGMFVGALMATAIRPDLPPDSCLIPYTRPVIPRVFSRCEMLSPEDTLDHRPRAVDPTCSPFRIDWQPVSRFVCVPEN